MSSRTSSLIALVVFGLFVIGLFWYFGPHQSDASTNTTTITNMEFALRLNNAYTKNQWGRYYAQNEAGAGGVWHFQSAGKNSKQIDQLLEQYAAKGSYVRISGKVDRLIYAGNPGRIRVTGLKPGQEPSPEPSISLAPGTSFFAMGRLVTSTRYHWLNFPYLFQSGSQTFQAKAANKTIADEIAKKYLDKDRFLHVKGTRHDFDGEEVVIITELIDEIVSPSPVPPTPTPTSSSKKK